MRCLECGAEIAKRAQVCPRCGSWAPLEYLLNVAEDPAGAAGDAAGAPAPAAIYPDVEQQRPESESDPEVDQAELAEWVQTRKFSTTRLRPGYDMEEVDAFLDEAELRLAAQASARAHDAASGPASAAVQADVEQRRPESESDPEVDRAELAEWVQTRKFSTTGLRPGYHMEEVDAFLDEAELRLAAQASARAHDAASRPASAAVQADVEQRRPESESDPEVDRAELAEWVQTRKFSTTGLRPGYDMEEVDTFLGAIRDTFLGVREPSLTPEEIRNKQFSTTGLRPGYDMEEVDTFLGAIRDTFLGVREPSLTPEEIRNKQFSLRVCGPVTTWRRLTPSSMSPN